MIKMIAIDLDGTLLNDQKQISERNKQVLAKAKAAGVKIVICTGRPLKAIEGFLNELNLLEPGDYSITFNGGLVQKNDTGEIMEQTVMEPSDVQKLHQLALDLDIPLDVLSEGLVLQLPTSPANKSIYSQLNKLLDFKASTLAEIDGSAIYNKVVVALDQVMLDAKIAEIPAAYYEDYEVIKTRSNLLEFMPKGITKGYGISLLAKDLGIEREEIMGIGDEENDLPMIEYVGMGVAMANAVEKVHAAADYVTASNQEDGVAQAIEQFVLN
ncbi:haloacid dehalogenase [Enterococcus sp. JM4C]|uniref:Cof-type HAD-IIB family hydrolase n=1 Tax=Candidatus Enterococcus huntleyi TaxID=1857217 RepID=UPI00137A6267|nr:Cof-type HAD-IIB family hydrolase [Enterococcus sp. JM4C]KAF1297908.1 haloacid dehalogenase [Enterococcus sp. JM4C]